jgi:FkbM family methyltransferase
MLEWLRRYAKRPGMWLNSSATATKAGTTENERIFTTRIGNKSIALYCPTEISKVRAQRLLDKEPGTIAWIDGFSQGDILWDIGANIGVYSLYAAMIRNCDVYAIEPAAANYYGLNCNIVRNRLDGKIKAIPVAIDDRSRFDALRMRDNEIGGSLHVFGKNIDYKRDEFVAAWMQGALAVRIDDLHGLFGVPMPTHIKIDVDGIETAVVRSGQTTLADSRLKSVLVEVDLNDTEEVAEISQMLQSAGLVRDESVPGNTVRAKCSTKIYNLIFRRPSAPAEIEVGC